MYNKICCIVTGIVKNEVLLLDTPLIIRSTPRTPTLYLWAICVASLGDLFVRNEEGQWHQVEIADTELLNSLYQYLEEISSRHIGKYVESPERSNLLVA